MGGVTCNPDGFAGEAAAIDVQKGGKRDADDPLSCSGGALQSLPAGGSASAVPRSDAAGRDALNGASGESVQDGPEMRC